MIDPVDEAAQILTRLLESLARRTGKTLNERGRANVRRACELLSHAGEQYTDLLDDLPEPQPRTRPARDYTTMPIEVEKWREERDRR